MSTLTKALDLAEQGFAVFPLNADRKPFGGTNGLNDATRDPGVIEDKFSDKRAKYVGVNTGRSGLIVLDLDQKNGKDGFESLENAWLSVEPTFFYQTPNGGEHHVYLAPNDDYYKPATNYRDLAGVDRRSGGGYVVWYGDVPGSGDVAVAPEWLCDTGATVEEHKYDGDPESWVLDLTPGEASAAVRRAEERVSEYDDLSHSDMVKLQFNAVRLGAEGHPGVPALIDTIKRAWLGRNPELHSTPEDEWRSKFDEALDSAIRKYGQQIEEVANLPEFSVNNVPQNAVDLMLGEGEASPNEWTRSLSALVETSADDAAIASTLWYAPRTLPLSREWGIEFVYQRITAARTAPLPSRENPTIGVTPDELEEVENGRAPLLSDSERAYIANRPTFVDNYIQKMKSLGFVNETLARPSAWTCASMAFAFKAFIPKSGTDNMGLNLWFMTPAHSGTGKAQPLHSKVLTPTGWTTMGEIKVGDFVSLPDGGSAPVAGVYPQGVRPVYRLTFADGRTVDADEDHLWVVTENSRDGEWVERTTKELLESESTWFVPAVKNIDRDAVRSIQALRITVAASPTKVIGLQSGDYRNLIDAMHAEGLSVTSYYDGRIGRLVHTMVGVEESGHEITSIEYVQDEPTQCILVDHPSHQYVTDGFIRTHNTRSRKNQNSLLYLLFEGDNDDSWFQLGEDSSIQGLNLSLLQRDRQASLLDIDEASGFFERMAKTDWMTGMDSTLSHWYEGRVSPSNKISLKDLRGKSALTSFNIHMLATPDRLFDTLTRDLFKTGFLARFNWVLGPPPFNGDERFRIQQYDGNGEEVDMDQAAAPVRELAVDLWAAAALLGSKPRPILMNLDAQERMSTAYRKMYRQAEGGEDWDIVEPAITRLSETMHKIAAICAIYRGVDKIELVDALHAINEVQTWYDNLFLVAARVSEGEFQADASEIESYVSSVGVVTHNKLYHTFRNMVVRSRRDLDDRVEWLITSGRINRLQEKGVTKYEINGVA